MAFHAMRQANDYDRNNVIASTDVNRSAVSQFAVAPGNDFLKKGLGLVVLMFLHRAQSSLVGLQQLRELGVTHQRVLGCRFLCHVKDFPCLRH